MREEAKEDECEQLRSGMDIVDITAVLGAGIVGFVVAILLLAGLVVLVPCVGAVVVYLIMRLPKYPVRYSVVLQISPN